MDLKQQFNRGSFLQRILGSCAVGVVLYASSASASFREFLAPDSVPVVWGSSSAYNMENNARFSLMRIPVINHGRIGAGFFQKTQPWPIDDTVKGRRVVMYFGTNDVADLILKPQQAIDDYAKNLVAIAQEIRAKGGDPVLLGMNAPDRRDKNGQFEGFQNGDPRFWHRHENVKKWIDTMERVNEACEIQAGIVGIKYRSVDKLIPPEMLREDGLHLGYEGSRMLLQIGLE